MNSRWGRRSSTTSSSRRSESFSWQASAHSNIASLSMVSWCRRTRGADRGEPQRPSRRLNRHHPLFKRPPLFLVVLLTLAAALSCQRGLRSNAAVKTSFVASEPKTAESDYSRHVEQLKKKLPAENFTIVVQPPFVVIGDESAEVVKQHSEHTVKWAVDKLKQDYFSADPKEILDIWLFKDATSYERNALALFGDKPSTPYGYYSSRNKALIMNISTGGGTLVHEIVHPFIEANFPKCPPWLNEGLGSLYEQSGEVDGHIHGYTNWRLPGLQTSIKAGTVRSFRGLT